MKERLRLLETVRDRSKDLVGRAESDDGLVSVEYTSVDGVRALKIHPRMMRKRPEELSESVISTVRAAQGDLRLKASDVLKELGAEVRGDVGSSSNLQATRAKVRESYERFASDTDAATARLREAQSKLRK